MSEMNRRDLIRAFSVITFAMCESVATPMASAGPQRRQGPFDELIEYDGLGLAELIKRRQISAEELLGIVQRRIAAANPLLNFMTNTCYEKATQHVADIDPLSTFAGVPILIKDMIDVAGVPRTDGSRLFRSRVTERNVRYIDGIEGAGLNIIGMTNVPELASLIITDNDLFGPTRNPWNLDYSPFASSGGSACAVAAGVVPIAHGTDGAGSNRLPPNTTGLLGMKPSRYRMLPGESNGEHDLAKTNHVITRTVRDSAAVLNATEDKSGEKFPPIGLVKRPLQEALRIAYVDEMPSDLPVASDVKEAHESTKALLESLGHTLFPIDYPVDFMQLKDSYLGFFAAKLSGLAAYVEQVSGKGVSESGLLTHLLATNIESSEGYPEEKVTQALAYLNSLPEAFARIFTRCDLIVTPVSPVSGVKLDEIGPDRAWNAELASFTMERLKFTSPANFAGIPAMSVPLNWNQENMPVGSQFLAAAGEDRTLYELAYQLEEARPWKDRWAPHSLMYADAFGQS
ncbi:MAG: amidase [Halieaceae bacterium]